MPLTAYWTPYVPDDKAPWDLRRVVHLHRRAGFAAPWQELERDLKDGPEKSIDRLVKGMEGPSTPEGFATTADLLAESAVSAGEIGRLKAWWFYRVLFGPDVLGEKLTLLWHDHFATAQSKVRDVALMRRQNDTFRKHARGKFTEVIPVHRLAYSFGWEGRESMPPGSGLIEIDLIDQGGGTLLRMAHSGLPDAIEVASHGKGWAHYLSRLGVAATGGDPGPDIHGKA